MLFTVSMSERMTGSILFSRGSVAVRSSWLKEERTVAIVRRGGDLVIVDRLGRWERKWGLVRSVVIIAFFMKTADAIRKLLLKVE